LRLLLHCAELSLHYLNHVGWGLIGCAPSEPFGVPQVDQIVQQLELPALIRELPLEPLSHVLLCQLLQSARRTAAGDVAGPLTGVDRRPRRGRYNSSLHRRRSDWGRTTESFTKLETAEDEASNSTSPSAFLASHCFWAGRRLLLTSRVLSTSCAVTTQSWTLSIPTTC
jgi:hypothetical protein